MNRKSHVIVTQTVLTEGFDDVHQWIDETYRPHLAYLHWLNRHHKQAVREKYGEDSWEYEVALLHIATDFLSHFGKFYVPENREECEAKLKELGVI